MRKLAVLTFMTLDGVMQGPGGPEEDTSGGFERGGWLVGYFDDVLGQVMGEQTGKPFAMVLGRKTYEVMAAHWPNASKEEGADTFNSAKKYVASRTLDNLTWENSELLAGDVVEAIEQLKRQDGPELQVHGSSDLVQTLLKYDVVDLLYLKIFPVTLGTGKRLFGNGTIPAGFKLVETKVSPSGVIVANYERAGEIKSGSL